MFCENCGSAIKDGAKFCGRCGAPVKMKSAADAAQPAAAAAPVPYPENAAGNTRINGTYYNEDNSESRPAGRLQSFVAGVASSKLFLAATILFTAVLVINLLSSIMTASVGGNVILGILDEVLYQAGYSFNDIGGLGMVSSVVDWASAGTIVASVISMIPSILIAIGLWLIFASAKSSRGTSVKPAGFTIIKVIYLIFFWIMIVIGAIAIIMFILAIVLTADYSGAAAAAFIVALVLIAVIVALTCLYCSKIAKMLTSAREVGTGASDSLMVSTYVQVLTWIAGICLAISAIASIGSMGLLSSLMYSVVPTDMYTGVSVSVSAGFIVPFLVTACSAAATICFAIIIGKMKSREH
ncbi:MAG: zinc ribbon domain-containing protein [Lachnospiraceae bacterium]|nr:zinc ribbon domain-containing protein [Lachnospiraceae bacterium]